MTYIDDQLSDHTRDLTNLKDALRDMQWRVECLESLNAAREPTACGEAVASQPTYASGEVPMVGDEIAVPGDSFARTITRIDDGLLYFDEYDDESCVRPTTCHLIRSASPPQPASEPASDGEKSCDEPCRVFIHSNGFSTARNMVVEIMRKLNLDDTDFRLRDSLILAAVPWIDREREVAAAATKAKDAEIAKLQEDLLESKRAANENRLIAENNYRMYCETQNLLDHVKCEADKLQADFAAANQKIEKWIEDRDQWIRRYEAQKVNRDNFQEAAQHNKMLYEHATAEREKLQADLATERGLLLHARAVGDSARIERDSFRGKYAQSQAELERVTAERDAALARAEAAEANMQVLLDYFRDDEHGKLYGREGDHRGWSTAKCAVEIMKRTTANWLAEKKRAEEAEKEAAKYVPLQSLANEIREINKANGWNVTQPEDWMQDYKIPAILALITSEVSEALEAFRKGDPANFCEELADTLIRVLDCIVAFDSNFDATVRAKMEKNKTRGHKHGGKRV